MMVMILRALRSNRGRSSFLMVVEVIGVDYNGLNVDRGEVHVLSLDCEALWTSSRLVLLLLQLRRVVVRTAYEQLVVLAGAHKLTGSLR